MASPQLKTGRYSKYLPDRLAERYHDAVEDRDLLALREDIALLDSRLADLLQRVDSGESGKLWQELEKAIHSYARVRNAHDKDKATAAWFDVEAVVEKAQHDYMAWAEIHGIIEQRRRLSESERKRLTEMQQMVTAEEAMLLIRSIAETVKQHVRDRDTLAAISADFARILGPGVSRRT